MSQSVDTKPAERQIAEANAAVRQRFAFDDTQDLQDARRGFMGTAKDGVIRDREGRAMWDLGAYGFLDQDRPDTANPSLWRQSRLCSDHGLFEVMEGIYQVRGFDLSNMTIVEGERGILVIDPLLCAEVGVPLDDGALHPGTSHLPARRLRRRIRRDPRPAIQASVIGLLSRGSLMP